MTWNGTKVTVENALHLDILDLQRMGFSGACCRHSWATRRSGLPSPFTSATATERS